MKYHPILPETKRGRGALFFAVTVVLLVAMACSGGCIKTLQKSMAPAQEGDAPLPQPEMNVTPPPSPAETPDPLQDAPVAVMTPAKSAVVTEIAPFITPDPYPIIHGTRINDTPQNDPLDRNPEFEKTYHLSGNATGLLVNVVQGPLYIIYEVTPKYDCMASPETCRGTATRPINRPYLTITVRDNQTHEIVAEDGYGREYSSDIGRYMITIKKTNADGTTTESTSYPGPRYIPVYKEGVYYVTIEGSFLDVNVKILTGDSPSRLEGGNGDTSSQDAADSENTWN